MKELVVGVTLAFVNRLFVTVCCFTDKAQFVLDHADVVISFGELRPVNLSVLVIRIFHNTLLKIS